MVRWVERLDVLTDTPRLLDGTGISELMSPSDANEGLPRIEKKAAGFASFVCILFIALKVCLKEPSASDKGT